MGKSDYSKAEDAFGKEMEKIKIERIRKLAEGPEEHANDLNPSQMMLLVNHHLKWMKKQDKDIFKNIKLSKKEVDDLTNFVQKNRENLKTEEIERVKMMYKHVEDYKEKNYPAPKDDEHIGTEKGRHIYKRHNISEKWLPLDVPPVG